MTPYAINHPGLISVKESDLAWVTPEALNRFQGEWLSKGSGLELFVLGNVTEPELIRALEATIAGVALPPMSGGSLDPLAWRDAPRLEISAHSEDRIDIEFRIRLDDPLWDQQQIAAVAAAMLLEEHLMAVVREQQGDSYDVWALVDQAEPEIPGTYLLIGTSTGPERAGAVIDTIATALEEPQAWVAESGLEIVRSQRLEEHKQRTQSLDSLLADIEFYTRHDRSLADYPQYEAMVSAVDVEQAKRMLAAFADSPHRLLLTIQPKQ